MGIDMARERVKHLGGSHEERLLETVWGKGEVPWEKLMREGKERVNEVVSK